MDKYVYAVYMIYAILFVIVVAFSIYIAPAVCITIWESLAYRLHPCRNELVERLLLAVEEMREWHHEPGKHRPHTSGIHRADDTYFHDLNKMWAEVEESLRVDLKKKAFANV